MDMTLASQAATCTSAIADEFLPFALLTIPAAQQPARGTSVARREVGTTVAEATLTIAGGQADFAGLCCGECADTHREAMARVCAWLGGAVDGTYPVRWMKEHRALVEADVDGLAIECRTLGSAGEYDALALAWVAALMITKTGDPRRALGRVGTLFAALTTDEQLGVITALADGTLDAGHLCTIFLTRYARETSTEELERWESWFLGQRQVDLPYNRQAVIDILESTEIDPDEKRLRIHDVIVQFDWEAERANITRTVAKVRANNQELIFGRLCRAFHNQSLLFANAGYVQVDDALRGQVMQLVASCAGSPRLAPAIDRLRMFLTGAREAALTGAIGAVELLEDAILDDQRQRIEKILQTGREGRAALATDSYGEILTRTEHLLELCRALRETLTTAPRRPAAFVFLSQRFFPLETHLLSRINELQEPYLGKPDNLQMLVRKGGHRMYASPDYSWLQHADHWVEAIPLFIKERVLVVDGVEVTETVIDQQAMEESFREQFADHWALNIDNVMDSEHVALARELLGVPGKDDRARAAAVSAQGLAEAVAALAALIGYGYSLHVDLVNAMAEKESLLRYDALRAILLHNIATDHPVCLAAEMHRRAKARGTTLAVEAIGLVAEQEEQVRQEAERLARIADQPRRAVPALHVLTTQSARMSDNYVRTWIEESMAIFNVIRAYQLGAVVNEKIAGYRTLVTELGNYMIDELGMRAEVEELKALENLPEAMAVSRVVAGNASISRQVSILAVLAEHLGLVPGAPVPLVEELLATRREALQEQALRAVYARNDLELLPRMDVYRQEHAEASELDAIKALILDDPEYADDLAAFTRLAAREEAIRELDRQDPALKLAERVRDWLRYHTRLSLTTARREVLVEQGLNHLVLHPRYYYRAAGGNKRFHQLYTPSRVDLGTRERETVETWSQWVGGADREASRVGRRVYGLINKNPKMFDSLTEPEVLKSGENASMVAHFSYSNAMSLLVNSVGRGDIEEIGDQMSLRKDRYIHPGGEGYGGYCVPKDGLFLEFVLILTRATKLQQLGVPDQLHAGVVKFAHALLSHRGEFATEIEWEAWAMSLVADRKELAPFFSLRQGTDEAVPVFQITRIAKALTQLGRPELTDSFDVLANLAARWGIHKIIVGGEQVNRFMPFYKTWLTYRAVEDAARMNPTAQISPQDFSVVLSAEYKPDTQDGRFSVGMRKYELYAGTGDHLTYSLDTSGQDLAHLMLHGFDSLWLHRSDARLHARLTRLLQELQVSESDEASIARLREMFPGYRAPGEIRMVSPMKLTTSDLLHYTSDTQLEHLAQEARRRLVNAGLTDSEIDANMQVYGPRLARWTKLRDLPAEELETLRARIGGAIHALALSVIGPAGNYEMAIQGADVVDTGIPNRDLLALVNEPVKLRDLMLSGNPHSALVIIDGASGARRRALNRLAVMRWLAAGEAIGREAIYRCVGVGTETIESWRTEMRHQRARALGLFDALAAGNVADARERFAAIVADLRDGQESALFLESEERMLRFKKETPEETTVARALAAVASGLPLEQLDFATWLALGGQFALIGAPEARMAEMRQAFDQAVAALGDGMPFADEYVIAALYCPAYVPAVEEFREEKGIESSNKATEEVAVVAIDTRKRLAERAARAKALRAREQAFTDELATSARVTSLAQLLSRAHEVRGDGTSLDDTQYGQLQALTRLAFLLLGRDLFADAPEYLELLTAHVEALFIGRVFDPLALRAVSGGYEDPGDIARLAQRVAEQFRDGAINEEARDRGLAQVADVAELFDCCRAADLTIDFFTVRPDAPQVWRALADFFAESVNDHFFEYRPWVYSRGIGFAHLEGDALYAFALARHQWLYRYLRGLVLAFTELAEWDIHHVAELLGDLATAADRPAIGGDAETALERQWRAYNQLREVAFIRNDGFPLPQVFPAFDPEIIQAEARTNLLLMYPVGRTHVSRALMEGPTLASELVAAGRPGANLLISRDAKVVETPGMTRPVLQAHNAHLYISCEEYITALVRHRGLSQADAEALAARHVGPKGIRVAARFTRPVTVALVFPFHGHPKYTGGLLEDLGLPYSCQTLFHTWTTYDKAKYPAIFSPETGVEIPGEMDWLASFTAELGEDATLHALEHGDASRHFAGFRAFAGRFRRVMVKDAAESGGRGQKAFNLRANDGTLDEMALADAVMFTYQISLKHNVAIQEIIISSPEYWATEAFLQAFVDRQIQDWGAVVNRTSRPRTSIYGSHRLVFSSADPQNGAWHVSHPIALCSRQLITNVGRGGTLDLFRPECIRPEFRDLLWTRMRESGEKCMAALARYGTVGAAAYQAETGRAIGEDATGLSYAVPRYMMLDFIVQPVFAEAGTLIDLEPVYDAGGERVGSRFILQQGEQRIVGTVKDWRVVLIEPNIGIGLWDRLAIREEVTFVRDGHPDMQAVGTNARIVLRDLAKAGDDYLAAIQK